MDTRFYIDLSQNVPNAGTQPIRLGFPNQLLMENDICICCRGSSDFIALNAGILQCALINSPHILKLMGLKVVPYEEEDEKPVENKKKKSKGEQK